MGWRLAVFRAVAGCHGGIDGPVFPRLRASGAAPSHIPWPFLDLTLVLSGH